MSNIPIENILGTKSKIKILKLLVNHRVISFSEIKKQIRLNHTTLKKYLRELERAGIIKEHEINRFRIYSMSKKNPRAKLIEQLIKYWDNF